MNSVNEKLVRILKEKRIKNRNLLKNVNQTRITIAK